MGERAEFLDYYEAQRVSDQKNWYDGRRNEYRSADRQGEVLQQLLLAVSAGCGLIGAAGYARETVGVVATVAAALAVLVASWRDLVGFRVNAELYDAASEGIAHARPGRHAAAANDDARDRYVDQIEDILLGETRTWAEKWGRFVADGSEAATDPPDTESDSD